MSHEELRTEYRYLVVSAKDDEELLGVYNNLSELVDKYWNYFASFPNKFVVIDTKDNTRFTIAVKQ